MSAAHAFCTIVAKNYLAHARTLAESLHQHHSETNLYVLIIDAFEKVVFPESEPFAIVGLSQLAIPEQRAFCFKYNVTELATAVKPYFMEYLIESEGLERLMYLDPDILVTARLDGIFDRLSDCDIVLTPHMDRDREDTGLYLSARQMMLTGSFNLGFVAINGSANARAFLRWWQKKLYEHCVIEQENGLFVDQKFVDVAITFFQNWYIERDPGYNAAPWNLHSRLISRSFEGEHWLCNGKPLFFFHFSGFRPLSLAEDKTWNVPNTPGGASDLLDLYREYAKRLHENGFLTYMKWSYGFQSFASGRRIAYETRRLFRRADWLREVVGNPFTSRTLKVLQPIMVMIEKVRESICSICDFSEIWLAVCAKRGLVCVNALATHRISTWPSELRALFARFQKARRARLASKEL